ncbi:MAG: hypothetical protein GWO40_01020 [Gammaproteobacteria bacterium]|nr:hypothetical protein [Gammaproteobacteria bacterium]NIU02887.1 hypothetical protein [Gammaproteobacteria bacterium]NIV50409.1 hypothetical protein [Gammaproteobacteria bacterium]NIV73786.1 hypothetical protein [Gammaproteobacteria bacterium]NIX84162.1 hypothetical protein [Gammaproteobacteria bacterium]
MCPCATGSSFSTRAAEPIRRAFAGRGRIGAVPPAQREKAAQRQQQRARAAEDGHGIAEIARELELAALDHHDERLEHQRDAHHAHEAGDGPADGEIQAALVIAHGVLLSYAHAELGGGEGDDHGVDRAVDRAGEAGHELLAVEEALDELRDRQPAETRREGDEQGGEGYGHAHPEARRQLMRTEAHDGARRGLGIGHHRKGLPDTRLTRAPV